MAPEIQPPYGGAQDTGVAQSVPAGHDARGDVVGVLRAERQKLDQVFEALLRDLDAGGGDDVRSRWGGVVREVFEHAVAVERVLGYAVPDDLRASLSEADALNAPADAERVRAVIERVRRYQADQERDVVPRLQQLPEEERARLGEDLRQTAG